MLPKELIRAVKRLEITARRAVNDQLAGQYHSVFKGRGMDFSEVREYQPGDDVRTIDWNVSARMDTLFVKQFVEERELTVFLLVDASGSQSFGSEEKLKLQTAAELAALVAFSAIKNNDRVGLITYTDDVETFVAPKKGRKHVLHVITEILQTKPRGKMTNTRSALEFLSRVTRKRGVVFVISDFMDEGFERMMQIVHRRHEVIPVVISDPMEEIMPDIGLVAFEDPETGEQIWVDTSSVRVRDSFNRAAADARRDRDKMFRRMRIEPIYVQSGSNYVEPLVEYFRRRAKRAH